MPAKLGKMCGRTKETSAKTCANARKEGRDPRKSLIGVQKTPPFQSDWFFKIIKQFFTSANVMVFEDQIQRARREMKKKKEYCWHGVPTFKKHNFRRRTENSKIGSTWFTC